MANIKLKSLITEAEDFQAKSKQTGKLVHFKSKDAYQAALKAGTHEDPKAKKGEQPKAAAKPNSMFGGDYAKDRGGEAPTVQTQSSAPLTHDSKIVKALASKTGVNGRAAISWAEKNGVDLAKIASDVESKKLNPMDFMTAVVGNTGNKYAKDIISKYSQSAPNSDASVDGQSDDELYDALYDMGYDFGELGSDDFDEEGFSDAAINLGYRWDDKNKVWNHRDAKNSSDTTKADTPKSNLPKKASQLNFKHSTVIEKAINAELGLDGYADTNDNGAIMYNGNRNSEQPTYTLYFGSNEDYGKPDEFRVTLESTYGNDPAGIDGKVDKSFKSAEEAMKFMAQVAKKYKKELQMDDDTNESTKLTSMIKK